jgi:hypothetical protein
MFVICIFDVFAQKDDNQAVIMDFYNNPVVDKSVALPYSKYKSYDELFKHLGNPAGEFSTNFPSGTHFEGDYVRGLVFNNYDICTIYSALKDVVYVYLVWFTLENVRYTYNIKKNDTPEKIIEIFGDPLSTYKIKDNIFEYDYKPDFSDPRVLKFQFTDRKLTAIILWEWT